MVHSFCDLSFKANITFENIIALLFCLVAESRELL